MHSASHRFHWRHGYRAARAPGTQPAAQRRGTSQLILSRFRRRALQSRRYENQITLSPRNQARSRPFADTLSQGIVFSEVVLGGAGIGHFALVTQHVRAGQRAGDCPAIGSAADDSAWARWRGALVADTPEYKEDHRQGGDDEDRHADADGDRNASRRGCCDGANRRVEGVREQASTRTQHSQAKAKSQARGTSLGQSNCREGGKGQVRWGAGVCKDSTPERVEREAMRRIKCSTTNAPRPITPGTITRLIAS